MTEAIATIFHPVGERDDRAQIHCPRAGRRMLPSEALDDVLNNDVKNMDVTCACCGGKCTN